MTLEAEKCQHFDVKEKVERFPMKFGRITISKNDDSFCISQQEYADSLEKISINNAVILATLLQVRGRMPRTGTLLYLELKLPNQVLSK